jgi:hypothetical protein
MMGLLVADEAGRYIAWRRIEESTNPFDSAKNDTQQRTLLYCGCGDLASALIFSARSK